MNKIWKSWFIFGAALLIIFVFVPCSDALFKRDLKKAKNLISEGMYEDAIPFLEKAVLERMTNAEVHFLLGLSYLWIILNSFFKKTA